MPHPSGPNTAGNSWCRWFRGRGAVGFLFCCLLLGGLSVLANCSDRRQNYKVLSIFFDGVPDPDAPPEDQAINGEHVASTQGGKRLVIASSHKPYKENKCNDCHVGAATSFESFTQLNDSVCVTCHKQVPAAYPLMHGPVAVGACMMCHDPHESSQPHLLKVASPDLCLQCHQRHDLGAPMQDHQDAARGCLDCHVGHGSNRHGLPRDVAVFGDKGTPPNDPEMPKESQPPSQPAPPNPAPSGGQP